MKEKNINEVRNVLQKFQNGYKERHTDTFDKALPIYLEQMTQILQAEDKDADEKLLEASHYGVRRLRERLKGAGYQWPFVISAILQKEADQWLFHTIHWSMPVD